MEHPERIESHRVATVGFRRPRRSAGMGVHHANNLVPSVGSRLLSQQHLGTVEHKTRRRTGGVSHRVKGHDPVGVTSKKATCLDRLMLPCMIDDLEPDLRGHRKDSTIAGGDMNHDGDATVRGPMAKKKKGSANQDPNNRVIASNRRARRDFQISETFECGMVLRGSEVKSLREASVQIAEAYARVQNDELWIYNLHVAAYSHSGAAMGHDPDRRKKLLANRSEITKIAQQTDKNGLTLVPLSLYFKNGKAKLELGLARRMNKADRRQDIAKRDASRDAERDLGRRNKYGD